MSRNVLNVTFTKNVFKYRASDLSDKEENEPDNTDNFSHAFLLKIKEKDVCEVIKLLLASFLSPEYFSKFGAENVFFGYTESIIFTNLDPC